MIGVSFPLNTNARILSRDTLVERGTDDTIPCVEALDSENDANTDNAKTISSSSSNRETPPGDTQIYDVLSKSKENKHKKQKVIDVNEHLYKSKENKEELTAIVLAIAAYSCCGERATIEREDISFEIERMSSIHKDSSTKMDIYQDVQNNKLAIEDKKFF